MNFARVVGWGFFFPVFFFAFRASEAAAHWFIAAALMSYVYPQVVAQITKRTASPVRWVLGGLFLESFALVVFAEIVCMDPVMILVAAVVMVFNAGATKGSGASLAVLTFIVVMIPLLSGRLRAVAAVDLPVELYAAMGLLLMGYIILTTHQAHSLLLRHVENKRKITLQKMRLETLHTYLVETIANPFVSDEAVLEIIGPELNLEKAKKYRGRIRTRQQWESLGRQTRGLAHDAKNLLQPLVILSELLEENVKGDADAEDSLADLNAAVNRLDEIFSKLNRSPQEFVLKDEGCVVRQVVSEAVSLLKTSAPSDVKITFENKLGVDLVVVLIDASSLHRSVVNICLNAIHALKGPGTIELVLRDARPEEAQRLETETRCVTLSIRDSGVGMSKEVLMRIFEPYYTTKGQDGGSGLGLANAHALLTDIGGTILVSSEVGVGSEFLMVMPTMGDS